MKLRKEKTEMGEPDLPEIKVEKPGSLPGDASSLPEFEPMGLSEEERVRVRDMIGDTIRMMRDLPRDSTYSVEVWAGVINLVAGELGPKDSAEVIAALVTDTFTGADTSKFHSGLLEELITNSRQTLDACHLIASVITHRTGWRSQKKFLEGLFAPIDELPELFEALRDFVAGMADSAGGHP